MIREFSCLRLAALAAAALLQQGCFGARTTLIGFPEKEGADLRETADNMDAFVRRAEERIIAVSASASAAGQPPGWGQIAALKLVDVCVALGNDEIGPNTGLAPQGTTSRRRPLWLYPRVTCPLVAESTPVLGREGDREWILPLLLHRQVFKRVPRASWLLGEPLSWLFLPDPGWELPTAGPKLVAFLRKTFHIVLVARNSQLPGEFPLDEGEDRYVMFEELVRKLLETETLSLTEPRDDVLTVIFRVPTAPIEARWKDLSQRVGTSIHEELFDVRIFPRIQLDLSTAHGGWRGVLESLAAGRWIESRRRISELQSGGALGGLTAASARSLAAGVAQFSKDLHYFDEDLHPVHDRAARLADALDDAEIGQAEVGYRLRDLEIAIGEFIDQDFCPAPVLLDDPRPESMSFSFIAAGDLQYDTDASALFMFLAAIDPTRMPQTDRRHRALESIPAEALREIRRAKFVVIAGDLGDGLGFSSSGLRPLADALGLTSPTSPYRNAWAPTTGEYPELREQLRRSSKAIFAVPGNHDGFTAYGGVLNQAVAGIGYFLQALPFVSPVGTWLTDKVSPELPTLVRIFRVTPPFYDGLVDWSYEMGPRNVAFNYRGCGFVALNSFDLHQVDRDQVGAVGNNWGGGLQDATTVWADVALRHFGNLARAPRGLAAPTVPGTTFVLMHHDPRGSLASKNGYVEEFFGRYNDITTPFNEITFGYLGLSWASITGLFLPVISPLVGQGVRARSAGENFQERWMRHTAWDENCHNAKPLLDILNRNLDGAPPVSALGGRIYDSARISHLFFAHDDTPVVGEWIQPTGQGVFPTQTSDQDWNSFGHHLKGVFCPTQSEHAPGWAKEMVFRDGRQATVIRMDDLGDVFSKTNGHGFHLVTVDFPDSPGKGPRPMIRVRWIPLPR